MKYFHSPTSTRMEGRRPDRKGRTPATDPKLRYAEDLTEVETALSRATLLLRPSLKKAA